MMNRDEFGIPTGEHTMTCGCKMKGRTLLAPCDKHKGPFKEKFVPDMPFKNRKEARR